MGLDTGVVVGLRSRNMSFPVQREMSEYVGRYVGRRCLGNGERNRSLVLFVVSIVVIFKEGIS